MSINNKETSFSEEFKNRIVEKNIGYVSDETINNFLLLLETELRAFHFSTSAENNVSRILDSLFDRSSFIKNSLNYPHYCKLLSAIASNSNYLCDVVVREPHLLNWLLHSDALKSKVNQKLFLLELKKSIEHLSGFAAKVRTLKAIKRREILRIGVKDILGISNLKQVTKELSIVAKCISNLLFEISLKNILEKKNLSSYKINYALVALGKLGAEELNYSSDIDLMLFYETRKKDFHLEQNLLSEAIKLFIESASRNDEAGFLYRVDFRLRPDGKASPLCGQLREYLHYYETRGEDWERQMLIKASYTAGSKILFKKFYDYLTPFIYPKYFSQSPLEQINRLRKNYLNKLSDDENIKLSFGGIRDIEFSVQALQLINGGDKKSLRKKDTLSALASLNKLKLISSLEYTSLRVSYIFFRRVEHFLQLMNDRQTHTIPADGALLNALVAYFNCSSAEKLFSKLNEHKKNVAYFYAEVFNVVNQPTIEQTETMFDNFLDKQRAKKNWMYLKEGIGLLGKREFDQYALTAFSKISSAIMNEISKQKEKDLYLENFARIIRSAKIPSIWYESFSNAKMFEAFTKLILNSQYSVELFAEDYTLRDHFLSGKVFTKITDESAVMLSPKQLQFILAVQFTLGLIDWYEFSTIKQNYLLQIIRKYFSENLESQKCLVVCAGSFGSNELTFHSDIDLLFICYDKFYIADAQKDFVIHLNEIRKILSPWNVDLRLRPEGKSSQLVWELEAYKNYLQTRARVWELQSLLKIKFICGDEEKYLELTNSLREKMFSLDKKFLREEILSMRKKLLPNMIGKNIHLKKSHGGITDIHFIADYFSLRSPNAIKTEKELSLLQRIEILFLAQKEINLQPLFDDYMFLKKLELQNQNLFAVSTSILSLEKEKIERLADSLNISANELTTKIDSTMKRISSAYTKILNR